MRSPLAEVLRQKGSVVHSIAADATVAAAVRRMNQESIGALLVTDGDRVVGIFTERDVLRRVVDGGREIATTKVGDVMTQSIASVRAATTIEEAMAIMTEKRCRHLPVMEGGRAVGMVSIGDLTKWIVKDQEVAIHELVEYIQGKYPG
jgi:CBS domain-containing protein